MPKLEWNLGFIEQREPSWSDNIFNQRGNLHSSMQFGWIDYCIMVSEVLVVMYKLFIWGVWGHLYTIKNHKKFTGEIFLHWCTGSAPAVWWNPQLPNPSPRRGWGAWGAPPSSSTLHHIGSTSDRHHNGAGKSRGSTFSPGKGLRRPSVWRLLPSWLDSVFVCFHGGWGLS